MCNCQPTPHMEEDQQKTHTHTHKKQPIGLIGDMSQRIYYLPKPKCIIANSVGWFAAHFHRIDSIHCTANGDCPNVPFSFAESLRLPLNK